MHNTNRAGRLPTQADRRLLAPKGGFFGGMGERGVGGSKCGATAAVALLFPGERGGTQLLAANVGDARVLLSRGGRALQPPGEPAHPRSDGRWTAGTQTLFTRLA